MVYKSISQKNSSGLTQFRKLRTASDFYKEQFGGKAYKISIDAGCTCPNRDGTKAKGGCIFCSQSGSGDFASDRNLSVEEQIENAKKLVESKLKTQKKKLYIAYFQNFTNTYGNADELYNKYLTALSCPDICALSIATRPDCLADEILEKIILLACNNYVILELGLQTQNDETGKLINRQYSSQDYVCAVRRIKEKAAEHKNCRIHIVTHIIFGLPGESEKDMLDSIRFCIQNHTDGIKISVLHVLKNTVLEKMYLADTFECLSMENYFDLIYKALCIIPEDIVIHRLTGDGAKKILIEPMWTSDKKNVHNRMKEFLKTRGILL